MKRIFTFAVLPLLCVSCFPTRIVTYTPASTASYYTTSVTIPRSNTTTYVTQVNAKSSDISLQLDLQAVGALYAQSSSAQEFEQLLNSQTYPVSNLDLNNDGYIDYLRVLETVSGSNHVYLIQALLSDDVYQDVATIVVERPAYSDYCLEIIGASYIYGPNYIVRPSFIARPPIFDHICRQSYSPWRSPWYWNHFPSYYRHRGPVLLNHYQSYVNTFTSGHRYCRNVTYPSSPHLSGYADVSRPDCRNDYGNKYPERSFTVRNANTPRVVSGGGTSGTVRNAYDIRMNSESTKYTTTSTTGRGSGNASTVTRSAGTASSSSTRGTTATSGSATRSATSTTSGTAVRSTAATSGSSTRSAASSSSSTTRGTSSSSGSATRSTASTSSSATSSTGTVRSSVRSSGSTTTTRSSSATGSKSSSSVSRSSSGRSSRSSSSVSRSSSGSSSRSSSSRSSSSGSSSRSGSSSSRSGSSSSRGSR